MAKNGKTAPFLATTPGLVLACLCACLLWGSAFPCVKIGYRLFGIASGDVASTISFAGARFVISGLLVVVAMSAVRRRAFVPARDDWGAVTTLSLFQTVGQYVLFYVGLSHATGVTSSIIESTSNFLCVLLAALAFRSERLSVRKVAGCLVGLAGVVLVSLGGGSTDMGLSLGGEGFVLLSTVSAAVSSNLAKRYSARHDPVLLSGWQFVVGGATLLVVGLALGGRVAPADAADPWPAVTLLAYMGFISAAAYSLWSMALASNPVSRVAIFGFMNPVFGVVLSAVLLGEGDMLDPRVTIVALALVTCWIVVVNRPGRAPRAAGVRG